jgi:hypothetical protein
LEKLDNDNNYIFVSRSHGYSAEAGGALFGTGIEIDETLETTFSSIPEGTDLSNLGLVIFGSCETGYGGREANNLPQKVVDCGAKSAIGFELSIGWIDANTFMKELFSRLDNGVPLETAVNMTIMLGNYIDNDVSSVVIFGQRNYIVY